jgi:hypothetical protein
MGAYSLFFRAFEMPQSGIMNVSVKNQPGLVEVHGYYTFLPAQIYSLQYPKKVSFPA